MRLLSQNESSKPSEYVEIDGIDIKPRAVLQFATKLRFFPPAVNADKVSVGDRQNVLYRQTYHCRRFFRRRLFDGIYSAPIVIIATQEEGPYFKMHFEETSLLDLIEARITKDSGRHNDLNVPARTVSKALPI